MKRANAQSLLLDAERIVREVGRGDSEVMCLCVGGGGAMK